MNRNPHMEDEIHPALQDPLGLKIENDLYTFLEK